MDRPNIDDLRADFEYRPDSGLLVWKESRLQAGRANSQSYLILSYKGLTVAVHMVIWALETGAWPVDLLDHKDGDPMNNRFANLRPANHTENMQNRKKPKNNTTGFKGVFFRKARKKYVARIKAFGCEYHLGTFEDPVDAAREYDKAAINLCGEFARTNFDQGGLSSPL